MRVRKLELIGFKSFGEKTGFELHPGITCIVGPNGCGKSNVVDSFKWVLGEQSAKSLRGDKMMEVIFDGSAARKQRGMAEVNLHVSGLNGSPDGAGGDATVVTRRLFRSGESDYMINRQPCRLKDIKDLFLDTGLELKSYSIFEQDNISRIINSRPEDRRFLIEEVAGVVKYKVRRAEAENKLSSSRLNLQRLEDIIGEVKRQINSLDRQAKKAERYKRLLGELKTLELKIARKTYLELKAEQNSLEESLTALKERAAARRAELSENENEHARQRLRMAEREKALNALQEEMQGILRLISEKERLIAVWNAEKEAIREQSARLSAQAEEFSRGIGAAEEKKTALAAEHEALSATLEGLDEKLKEQDLKLDESVRAIEALEAEAEEARKELFKATADLSAHTNETVRAELTFTGLKKRSEALLKEIEETGRELASKEAEHALLTTKSSGKEIEESRARAGIDEKNQALVSLEVRAGDLKARISSKRETLASLSSRAESLKEILLPPATAELLQSEALRLKAALGDVMEAAPEYEKAVEAALRELASGFVVESIEEALKAAGALRDKDIGRTTFIALDDLQQRIKEEVLLSGGATAPLDGQNGTILGRASDFVKPAPGYEPLVKNLLAGALVVKDLESVRAGNLNQNGFLYVSLAGEVLEGGAVTAGQGSGFLTKKRELRELSKEIEETRASITADEDSLREAARQTEEALRALKALEALAHELEKERSLLTQSISSSAETTQRLHKKSSFLKLEKEELEKEAGRQEETLGERASGKAVLEKTRAEKEEGIARVQENLSAARTGHEREKTVQVDMKMELNRQRQISVSISKEIEAQAALREETLRRLEKTKEEAARASELIKEKEASVAETSESLRETVGKADSVRQRLADGRSELAGLSGALVEFEKKIKDLRAELEELSGAASDDNLKLAECRMKAENLLSGMQTTYSVDIASYEAEPPSEEDLSRVSDVRQKMSELGPVSLATIDEYEELKTRFEFLGAQREDLARSISELEEAIKKINRSTRQGLRDAYDALRAKFAEVFSDFFGGGKAELVLTDEQNILETGVEIIVQPPGKKLQNINLLSGGEKSLTALSLLFASFLIKPTPLCVLDEAEASLDEPNTVKFVRVLKRMSSTTQFIVITHNRITMESADHIYGITMQEPGLSRVISMRLAEHSN